MGMPAWLRRFFREHELPGDRSEAARVDFVGRVMSPNEITSPITGLTASMMEIALVDWETVLVRQRGLLVDKEVDRFTTLGAACYGRLLEIQDNGGRRLVVESFRSLRVVPLSDRPLVLDSPPPPELADVVRKSQHMLSYREVRFREGDSVRVVATVGAGEVRATGEGYRDSTRRALVPLEGERLELHEML
jgi:hypothetical protein